MVAIFMAPVSAGFKINEARAEEYGNCEVQAGNRTTVLKTNITEKECKEINPGANFIPNPPGTETENNYSLGCGPGFWGMGGTIGGCIGSILYKFWEVSALLAQLGGYFLDFFIYYSTNSSSYANEFVESAWGAVRDIANIFFIIALLYVAIKTILGLNVTDNKKLVSSVIIIALIINFSLFTTKIVIDASNILAKVFYNNITSIDGSKKNADGGYTTELEAGEEGQKSISIGIISKFNPQKIIGRTAYNQEGGTGMFIFLTIVLLFVTLYTTYIFFSVALLFIARVISLWIAMIFSPLAFASYTVPFEIPGFGHKEWWPDLMKNAFLAPLFIFMLYIIISFSNYLKDIVVYSNDSDMMQKLMTVIIPFAIISILLMKAKSLAVKFSGDLGAAIQGAAGAIGGLALGGGALGLAAMGRGVAGRVTALASRSPDAMHYGNTKIAFDNSLAKWEKGGRNGDKPTWQAEKAKYIEKGGKDFKENTWTKLGGNVNASQKLVGDVDHARHEMDDIKKKAGLENVANENLSGVDKQKIEKMFNKEKKSEIEGDIRKGYNSKGEKITYIDENNEKREVESESDYKASHRKDISMSVINDAAEGDVEYETKKVKTKKANPSTGIIEEVEEEVKTNKKVLSDQGKKKVENKLDSKYNNYQKERVADEGKHRFSHLEEETKVKVSALDRIKAKSTSGSYDVRNIPTLTADKREGFKLKATVGLIAAIATGIRAGLKSSLSVDAGSPQKAVLKDLGNVITTALKNVKVDIKLGGDGGGKSHGGGGGHGGSVGNHSGHDTHGHSEGKDHGGGSSHGGGGEKHGH